MPNFTPKRGGPVFGLNQKGDPPPNLIIFFSPQKLPKKGVFLPYLEKLSGGVKTFLNFGIF